MSAEKPIAGVNLEAEQVIREEKEKPVKVGRPKVRSSYLVFGGILVVEALVLFMVFGRISGGDPSDHEAHADSGAEQHGKFDEATIHELGGMGLLEIGDVSISEPSIDQPGRSLETTIVALKVGVSQEAWASVAKVFEENPAAQELIVIDIRDHVRKFMSMHGGENLNHRQESIDDDLLRHFREMGRDSVGGLSRHFTRVGYEKVKSVLR